MSDQEINTSECKTTVLEKKIETINKLLSSKELTPGKKLLFIQAIINATPPPEDERYEDRIKSANWEEI